MTLRIYADFNGLVEGPGDPQRIAVVLDTFGSLRDLSNAGVVLSEGMPVIAVDASDEFEDLEGHGIARYDWEHRRWVVEFDEQGVRYVAARDRSSSSTFHCVTCRAFLPVRWDNAFGASCDNCGTSAAAAFAPPPRPDPGH